MGRSMNKEHAPMHNWALKQIKNNNFNTILDIGCGGGSIVNKFAKSYPNAKVYGIDYSADMVEMTRKKNIIHIDQKWAENTEYSEILDKTIFLPQ